MAAKRIIKQESQSFSQYILEIDKIEQINTNIQEEKIIFEKIRGGDEKEREKLIKNYLRLVVSQAKCFQQKNEHLGDLISEGNIGLMTAIEKFDVERGTKFCTLATFWIRQSILKYLYDYNSNFKVNPRLTNELRKMRIEEEKLFTKLERSPLIEEVIEGTGIDNNSLRAKRLKNLFRTEFQSLDSMFEKEYEEKENDDELMEKINYVLGQLTFKEKEILELTYGINEEPLSNKEITERLNLSRERISLLKKSGLERFKFICEKKNIIINI